MEPQQQGVSGKKVAAIILVIVLVFLIIGGTAFGIYAWRFIGAYKNLAIDPVDLSQLPDGVYFGSWNIFHVEVAVSLAVKDHRIVAIDVLDAGAAGNSGEGQANLETLINHILEEQTTRVDTVSGATATQKAFLKAVQEALAQPGQ